MQIDKINLYDILAEEERSIKKKVNLLDHNDLCLDPPHRIIIRWLVG